MSVTNNISLDKILKALKYLNEAIGTFNVNDITVKNISL
jgi:hypothetical protein